MVFKLLPQEQSWLLMFLGKLEVSGRHGYQRVEIMNLCVPVLLTSIKQCDCLLIALPFHETWISCTHSRDITPLGIQQVESVSASFQFSFCLIPNLLFLLVSLLLF